MLVWILRTLASLLLGFLVFSAFLLWLVFSAVRADLESGDHSRVSMLAETAEEAGYAYGPGLRREIDQHRYWRNHFLGRAPDFLLAAAFLGALLMGLLHLPNPASSLRWPGYALVVTGGAALLLGWLAQAVLPDLIGNRVAGGLAGNVTSAMADLLQGIGLPGLWVAIAGALLIVGSHVLEHWQIGQAASEDPEPGQTTG